MSLRILTILFVLNLSLCAMKCREPEYHRDYKVLDSLQLTDKKYFCIGDYNIYPHEKRVVITYKAGHGETGDHWEGAYLDTLVNFDSTTLVFAGEKYDFKEHINALLDVGSLKLLDYRIDDSYNSAYSCFVDNNYVYKVYSRGGADTLKISDMKPIHKWLYEKDSKWYFLSLMSSPIALCLVDKEGFNIDMKTLEHVADNCFTDKNGFYKFEIKYNEDIGAGILTSVKLEDAPAERPRVEVRRFYIVYGNSVYKREMPDWFYEDKIRMRKLNLNADNLKEYPIYDFYDYISIITDGQNSYRYLKQKNILEEIKIKDIGNWKQLTMAHHSFDYDEKESTLYFSLNDNNIPKKGKALSSMALFYNGNRFMLLGEKKEMLLQKVFINGDKELDVDNYRYIGIDLYSYRNVLYNFSRTKIDWADSADINNLKPVQHQGYSTYYFTDGVNLFYNARVRNYTGRISTFYVAPSDIKPVDLGSLKVIDRRMLIDKNNIYIEGEIIPRDSLRVKVKVM